MRLGPLLAFLAVVLGVGLLAPPPAGAADGLTLTAPAQYADRDTTLTIAGALPATTVVLERWDGAAWRPAGSFVAGDDGTVTIPVPVLRVPAHNLLRATAAGATGELRLPLLAIATTTTLTGPRQVVDERSITLTVVRRTAEGTPVPGPVLLQQVVAGTWRTVREPDCRTRRPRRDDADAAIGHRVACGRGRPAVGVRLDEPAPGRRQPAAGPAGGPARGSTPPAGPPARRSARRRRGPQPGGPPDPRRGLAQHRVGRSWHRGCPVGRSGLRLLRINYWDYSGYRRRGELVAAASVVRQMSGALADMYRAGLPIRSMYRVDRFGWSTRLQGADDYRSMAAGNTSAFNCRWVVGRPGVRSPHTYGRALDVNTWENPYLSRQGWEPNAWWPSRSHARVAWRSRDHAVVEIMRRHGLRWTYGRSDSQHFDAVPRGGRLVVVPGCGDVVCH